MGGTSSRPGGGERTKQVKARPKRAQTRVTSADRKAKSNGKASSRPKSNGKAAASAKTKSVLVENPKPKKDDGDVGAWNPENKSSKISEEFLQRCLTFCAVYGEKERWEELSNFLSEEEQQECATIMRLPLEKWQAISVDYEADKLTALIRFFTVAEVALPNCRCGDASPVIALAWRLRSMNGCMERQLLEWIRAHTDNRYLPYGPLY